MAGAARVPWLGEDSGGGVAAVRCTPHRLDHHRALWSFAESKAFRDRYGKFNTQIWAYHWLKAAVDDVRSSGEVTIKRE